MSVRLCFPPQAHEKWNRHLQYGLIFTAFLQLGVCLQFRWACARKWSSLALWSLKAIISFIFWLCPRCGVSVRCSFPRQSRRKCKQTPQKTLFSDRLSWWILVLFGGVCYVPFSCTGSWNSIALVFENVLQHRLLFLCFLGKCLLGAVCLELSVWGSNRHLGFQKFDFHIFASQVSVGSCRFVCLSAWMSVCVC